MNIYGKSVSSTAAAMYSVLCSLSRTSERTGHRDSRGVYVFASRRQLGQYIERSERTAQRVITELKAAGLICVRRMGLHSRDRIYIVSGGGSEAVKNGGSEIMSKSNNIQADMSISQDKTPAAAEMTVKAVDDAKIAEASARIGAPVAKKMQDDGDRDSKKGWTAKKGRPTAKRPRMTKAAKEAAKAQYRQLLERKLDMANSCWLCPDLDDEYRQTQSLIDLIAEAVSVKGRQIRVNGAGLTVQQYWNVVQNINSSAIAGLFDRLCAAEAVGGISNKRAYTLAAVYNAVQWDMMTQGASIPTGNLYGRAVI